MVKFKLDVGAEPTLLFFGISAHVHDHRICWSLNKALGVAMGRRKDDLIEVKRGRSYAYPVFEDMDPSARRHYVLVPNRHGDGILMRQHKQADHLLLVEYDEDIGPPKELFSRIRNAQFVLAAFPLEFADLPLGHELLI